MEKTFKTKAIVLQKKNWRENDLLFSLYTKDFGRVEAVAVGARRVKSKLVGHLSGLGQVEVMFARGKRFNKVIQAYLEDSLPVEKESDFTYSQSLFEIVQKATHTEEKNEKVWQLLSWTLQAMIGLELNAQKVLLNIFIIKLMEILGYDLQLDNCVKCRQPIYEVKRFSFLSHGFVCVNCKGGEIGFLQHNYTIIKKIQSREVTGEVGLTVQSNETLFLFLKRYLMHHLEREIVSLSMIK
jgi:DNA repair protein RecO (recombination protein O)